MLSSYQYDYTVTILTMSDFHAAVDKLEGTEVIIPQNDKFTMGMWKLEILVQDEEADLPNSMWLTTAP